VRKYVYEDPLNFYLLTGIVDENSGRFATWHYNDKGRAISSEHAGGVERQSLSFGGDAKVGPRWTDVTDALSVTRRYTFTLNAGLWLVSSVDQPAGAGSAVASSSTSYDKAGNLASHTDFNGTTTTYSYDVVRALQNSRTEASGTPDARTITTTWHPTWALPDTVTEPNRNTKFEYDTKGNLIKKTITASNGDKRVWSWTYRDYGLLWTATDPSNQVTTYTYDTKGNLATISNPAGQITQFTNYDANGNLLSMIDINQQTTTFGYDLRGRLKTRKTGSEQTVFDYDLAGQLKVVHFPDGSTLSYDYDAAHRLTDIRDSRNGRIHYDLFDDGNIKREDRYDPDGTLATALQQVATQRATPAQQAKAQ
jgi:YD repeat-containing protein